MAFKCDENFFGCILAFPVLCFVSYCVPLFTTHWVEASNANWGLWSWCIRDADKENCSSFTHVYNEGYFMAVRGMSILAFVAYTLSAFVFLAVGWREKERKRCAFPTLSLAAGVLTLTAIFILAANYQTDRTFQQHGGATLGWSLWLQALAAALTIFSTVFYCCIDDQRCQVFEDFGTCLQESCSEVSCTVSCPEVSCGCYCNEITTLPQNVPPASSRQNVQPTAPPPSREVSLVGTDNLPPPYGPYNTRM